MLKVRKVLVKGKIRKLIKENGIWKYLKHRCGCPCKQRIPYKKYQKKQGYIPDFIYGHQNITNEYLKNLISWLSDPTIIEDGIKKYKNHRCHCPCKQRIPFEESQIKNGIPKFINGHSRTSSEDFKRRNAILSSPTIIEYGIKVYENEYCHCEDKDGINCGLHIPYPINKNTLTTHVHSGIPKYIVNHHCIGKTLSEEHKKKIGRFHTGNTYCLGKHASKKTRRKQRKARNKYIKEHPELVGEDSIYWKGGKQASHRRSCKKHRELGFEPFNDHFKNSHAHHLDHDFVIHIPTELHKSIHHRQSNQESMKKINELALEFLSYQGMLKYYHDIKDDNTINDYAIEYINEK